MGCAGQGEVAVAGAGDERIALATSTRIITSVAALIRDPRPNRFFIGLRQTSDQEISGDTASAQFKALTVHSLNH